MSSKYNATHEEDCKKLEAIKDKVSLLEKGINNIKYSKSKEIDWRKFLDDIEAIVNVPVCMNIGG